MAYINGKRVLFNSKIRIIEADEETLDREYNNGYLAGIIDGREEGYDVGKEAGIAEKSEILYGILSRGFEEIKEDDIRGLTSVGGYAFYNYSALRSIELPESVLYLRGAAFQNCASLSSVKLPDTMEFIYTSAFQGCTSLNSIVIPASIKDLGAYSLRIGSATNKATITMLSTTPPTIASTTFDAGSLDKIIVPNGFGDVYRSATNWSAFADYIEEARE